MVPSGPSLEPNHPRTGPWPPFDQARTEVALADFLAANVQWEMSIVLGYFSAPGLRLCSTSSFCSSASDLPWAALSTVFSAISCTFW